jgi:hypothetical protein
MLSVEKHKSGDAVLVIKVIRTGGFAGLHKRWTVSLKDAREAAEWRPLIDACPWGEEPEVLPEVDRFVYRICTTTRKRERTAIVPEQHLTGPWRELVDRVRSIDKPHPRGSGI